MIVPVTHVSINRSFDSTILTEKKFP